MADLIDRQSAINKINQLAKWYYETFHETRPTTDAVIDALMELPSADVQPVRHGHWAEANTHTYGIHECDVCKGWIYIPNEPRDYKFCPRCGARMDGD